ncbi:MAG: SGNH/GDSL hydrolase family protein, partial [Muribaculaceae bacterium]|nr:SGNH/GDSL hydrolase family protein [Muribaculaceae bacterium]
MKASHRLFAIGLVLAGLMTTARATAQTADEPLRYVDALQFRMINKGFADTETPFQRLPKCLKDSASTDLWQRQSCSSGLGIRFATDSKRVGVRYTLLFNTHMFHMADTGLKGTDLYILDENNQWVYVNTNRPIADENKRCDKVFVSNLDGKMHEYLIYLPLYDGVTDMEISVDSSATICSPRIDNPRKAKKIVMYGTSILQGGCSTRTG